MQTSPDHPASISIAPLQQDLHQSVIESKHPVIQSVDFYESAILVDRSILNNYWYLGLSYLLSGRLEDAQFAWLIPLADADDSELAVYTDDLLEILEREASYRSQLLELEIAWSIRLQILAFAPQRVKNVLQLITLANTLDLLTSDLLVEWEINELFAAVPIEIYDDLLLKQAIGALLRRVHTDLSLEIVKYCLKSIGGRQRDFVSQLLNLAFDLCHHQNLGLFSVKLLEFCQSLFPNDLEICQALTCFYSEVELHAAAIATAEDVCRLAKTRFEQLFGSYLLQRAYFTAGNWQGAKDRLDRHQQILQEIVIEDPIYLPKVYKHIIISSFFSPYIEDNPSINRSLQNQLAAIYQSSFNSPIVKSNLAEVSLKKIPGIIRIGYLASTLRAHSVGWLSRWLFHYHDRDKFQIFIYCVNQIDSDLFNHKWFRDKVDVTYYLNHNYLEAVAQIRADEIDILIDLDSLTFDISCAIVVQKPAPVQVTWLGWDASGLPAIDYFIGDPYVLAENAQDYYQEKIWRLPQTYLAVCGFEVGTPTLKRQDLQIPNDAIVYFSSQGGYKRHPDNVRCQMRIIKAVPNSYLLIKGQSDPLIIRDFFEKIAAEEGVSLEQLRFLETVSDEYTHRANLAIADVVLDTFPYNGATTTLETLWMGIPMVTQVGQQFAARNSYTFMRNAGIEEGIAWSEQEYLDWGIKLGLDRELRWEIQGKLRTGRNTAPIWNARQFTLDMEQAYRGMWAKYQEQQSDAANDRYLNN
ncbi:O-linked N-acetylglucosamine transferase, SPINDLY family protein [Chamaesiphon sp.]|uniref:O-linked N-acetylglucosamine transferase, SPINDLY family protein n=1 Tax=Chamaesiphon sp. TaxID=2814140 RepID=UPI003593EC67